MTDQLAIELEGGRTAFRPGEPIRGVVSWTAPAAPASVKVCLVWSTEGKGTRDVCVAQTLTVVSSRSTDRQAFQLSAPEGPYTFSGKLISLIWAVELVLDPGGRSTHLPIVIAPDGVEIDLYKEADAST